MSPHAVKKPALDDHRAALADVAPVDFVRERNALALRLKEDDPAASRIVRSLVKPSPVAWALNQIARHHDGQLRAYLAAADRLQRVQTGKESGNVGDAIKGERAARHGLVGQATRILATKKINVTPDVRRRIADTLFAAATGTSRGELERGILTVDLQPGGLPDVGLVAASQLAEREARAAAEKAPRRSSVSHLRLVGDSRQEERRSREVERQRAAEARRREREDAAEAKRRASATKKAADDHARRVRVATDKLRAAERQLLTARDRVEKFRKALAEVEAEAPDV